ncbi:response regulator receiver and ANTAR domain protein [Desulforamulus reducens MI-1]|uniref:Stage 0 sporulation protein A homolog n=1 Tax=Desulforamulus reducens (strain ATCC BAA-1160 / DSM 100696 / MI-1) TaxID=349161 RepID=A4J420_DESRM|nr:response regulator [Desulforamulus reducens]ABO49823.1 response regulator receiver and ANTAR domain protein [Desulforamulus reducens MI-1]
MANKPNNFKIITFPTDLYRKQQEKYREHSGEEERLRVVLAEDEPIIRMDIRRMLEDMGHQVVGECRDGDEAIRLTKEYRPDVVLMDIKMPRMEGLAATQVIFEKMMAPVVLLTSFSDAETVQEAMDSGAFGYLVKPVDGKRLRTTLKVARQRFVEMRKLRTEVDRLSEANEDRIIISRSKLLLQKKLGCTEDEAFKIIRKTSMNRHCRMGEVAREILRKNI